MLSKNIQAIHRNMKEIFPPLCRIAIAIYDQETDTLKTFTHSTDGASPISYYSSKLAHCHALTQLVKNKEMRIIDNIPEELICQEHSNKIKSAGYQSSLTQPIFYHDHLIGLLFMNATEIAYFNKRNIKKLDVYIQLISTMLIAETMPIKTLQGAVLTARAFSRLKDEETGTHLARMSHYARIIALSLGQKHGISDEQVEYIFQFSPLHDVGKVGIPDAIILKRGILTTQEREVIQTHVDIGRTIIDTMIQTFNLSGLMHVQMLRNIVLYHHESYDGQGYPSGLKGNDIPLEARIASVADVFDALTSIRPYKKAWSNEDAFAFMIKNKNILFDPDCVDVLVANKAQLLHIQARFRDEELA
ncbi:MAG: HD-GYP domain-containing protein [Mariprofundaceae bacterium]|nr:HD-GYP domain-containing protein [Mariprofundaceae bacterium]